MASLRSRTLSSRNQLGGDVHDQTAREVADTMRGQFRALRTRATRVASDRRDDIEAISDAPLRRSLGGS